MRCNLDPVRPTIRQAGILTPINKPPELFPVASNDRSRFAFGAASDKIVLGQLYEGYVVLFHSFPPDPLYHHCRNIFQIREIL